MSSDNWTTPVDPSAGTIVRADHITYVTQNIQALYNGLNGDNSADAAMIHQHATGTFANRPAAGNAGRLYYCTDLGVTWLDDGTDWNVQSFNPTKCDWLFDDFQQTPVLGTTDQIWRASGAPTAGGCTSPADNQSMARLDKGTDASARFGIAPRVNTGGYIDIDARANTFVMEFAVRSNQSTGNGHICISDTTPDHTSTGGNNQIGVRKVSAGAWETYIRNGSTTTHNDTLEADDTDLHKCRIELTDANTIDFYWTTSISASYGAAAQSYSLSTDTTLTAAQLVPHITIGDTTASSRTLDIDFFLLAAQRY